MPNTYAKVTPIEDAEVIVTEEGDKATANIIVTNAHGRWYGYAWDADDWAYLEDNGEYIPVDPV